MNMADQKYFFPLFWVGLIFATYVKLGEVYLLAAVLFAVAIQLKRGQPLRVPKNLFMVFVGYYIAVSVVGLFTDSVSIKNLIEVVLKYVCLPYLLTQMIPQNESSRAAMLRVLKTVIFICAIYGLAESLIRYNPMVHVVLLDSRAWMASMNHARKYQPCSFFLHYNYYGCVLILGLILARYLPYRNRVLNLLYWALILEQIAACQSRICWIAAAVLVITEIFRCTQIKSRTAKGLLAALVGAGCTLAAAPAVWQKGAAFIRDRFSRLWIYGFEDGSLGQRLGTLMNWPTYFYHHVAAGFFGTGYHSVMVRFMQEYSFFKGYSTADCELTIYLVETGLIGVMILAAALFCFFIEKHNGGPDIPTLRKIGKMGLLAYLVECITLDIASNNIILCLLLLTLKIGQCSTEAGIAAQSARNRRRYIDAWKQDLP